MRFIPLPGYPLRGCSSDDLDSPSLRTLQVGPKSVKYYRQHRFRSCPQLLPCQSTVFIWQMPTGLVMAVTRAIHWIFQSRFFSLVSLAPRGLLTQLLAT